MRKLKPDTVKLKAKTGAPCLVCGDPLPYADNHMSRMRAGVLSYFCSNGCRATAARRWEDQREADRENKRRQRAKHHAQGLTSNGQKPKDGGKWCRACAGRIVAPTKAPLSLLEALRANDGGVK